MVVRKFAFLYSSWDSQGNSRLIGKDPETGKYSRQKEKRVTEDEMVRWHHRVNGYELGQTLLEMVKDREACRYTCTAVHGVAKSRSQLGD